MRKELQKINNIRDIFTGTFNRYGIKSGWMSHAAKTILLNDIKNKNGEIVADHLWFNYTKGMASLGSLVEGQVIEFAARVSPYKKGYINYQEGYFDKTTDYRLSHPTKLKIIS